VVKLGPCFGEDMVMRRHPRPAFTLIEVLIVVFIVAVLIAILIPMLARQRELARRNACAANMSGMGKGFYTYSENEWPIAAPNSIHKPTRTPVTYYNMTGRHGGPMVSGDPGTQSPGHYWDQLSTTRNIWQLVKTGGTSPKSLICPSSKDSPDTVSDPEVFWDCPAKPGDTTHDRGWNPTVNNETCISYGYQVPYGAKGRPTTEVDQRMALAADKGPYGGVSLNNNTVSAPPTSLSVSSPPEQWRPFNSPNHGGEGQVVLFADSHAEFLDRPIVGAGEDNIYTAWKRQGDKADPTTRMHGDRPANAAPFNALTPAENTDSLIYP
jgi:prepilin-type N-terminal cleavage/methylation domain-containing protein